MNYSDIRTKVKSGDIVALSHYKWSSWYDIQVQAVRVFTQSEYCHVGLVWVVGDKVFVIESVVPFVRITPLSSMAKEGFYWIPMDEEISEAELAFALSKVGKGEYSKWQAVKAQVGKLKIGADDLWQCCEFLIECRKRSNVNLGDKATPSAIVENALTKGKSLMFVRD